MDKIWAIFLSFFGSSNDKKVMGLCDLANPFRLIFETIAGGIATNKALKPTGKPKLTDILMEGISDGLPEVLKLCLSSPKHG